MTAAVEASDAMVIESFGMQIDIHGFGRIEQEAADSPVRIVRRGPELDAIWWCGGIKRIRVMAVLLGTQPLWMSMTAHSLFRMDGSHFRHGNVRLLEVFGSGTLNALRVQIIQAVSAAPDGLTRAEIREALGLQEQALNRMLLSLVGHRALVVCGARPAAKGRVVNVYGLAKPAGRLGGIQA